MLGEMKRLARVKDLCVLATTSRNGPHCSLMAYITNEDCTELFMVTHQETTKYRNLAENPLVSLLIDTREEHAGSERSQVRALTVSGTCRPIRDEPKRASAAKRLLERHPHLNDFIERPGAEILCIKITSFLLLDGLTDAHFEAVSS